MPESGLITPDSVMTLKQFAEAAQVVLNEVNLELIFSTILEAPLDSLGE